MSMNDALKKEIDAAVAEFPQLKGGLRRRKRGGFTLPSADEPSSSSSNAAAPAPAPSAAAPQTQAALRNLADTTVQTLENAGNRIDAAVANAIAHIPTIAATSATVAIATRPSILANIIGFINTVANSIPSLSPGFGSVAQGALSLAGQGAAALGTAGSYIATPSGITTLALFVYKRRAQSNNRTIAEQAAADRALIEQRGADFATRQIDEFNAIIAAANQQATRYNRIQLTDALGHLPRRTPEEIEVANILANLADTPIPPAPLALPAPPSPQGTKRGLEDEENGEDNKPAAKKGKKKGGRRTRRNRNGKLTRRR